MLIKNDCKYALVIPTSMGVRLTPADRQPVCAGNVFTMQATSAESNAGSVAAALGLPVKVLTAFVKESDISAFIKSELKKRNIDFEGKDVVQESPWGCRHQFNIADSGFGLRRPRVQNDRAGEVGKTLCAADFDLKRIFKEEGAAIVHISGLIAAISEETGQFCLDIIKEAKENGTLVSFDLNYRDSFWKGRNKELRKVFGQIAKQADILIGNEEDFQLSLGIEGPQVGGEEVETGVESFKNMIVFAGKEYPGVSVFAATLRQVIDANSHLWGAVIYSGSEWNVIEPRRIAVYDRIGGGDGFAGGLLYGILKGWESEKCIQFGWAAGALAASLATDYCQPANETVIWDIYKGNTRVKR